MTIGPDFATQPSTAMLIVIAVRRRGWFRDEIELAADQDISEEKIEGQGSMPQLSFYRFRMTAGEKIVARIPKRFSGRAQISLKEIGDCDGLRQRWERVGRL